MFDTKIYLVLCKIDEKDNQGQKTGRRVEVVSHGVGNNSLTNYCLPTDPLKYFAPSRDSEGWFIWNGQGDGQ